MIFREILICRPKYFDVIHYKLNVHMSMKNQIKYKVTLKQWDNLERIFINCGVKINYIKPQKNLVDMVFSANGALIYKNKALISNFNALNLIIQLINSIN